MIKNNGAIFKIDPLISYQEHDRDGNCLNNNRTNQMIIDKLVELGFLHRGLSVGYSEEIQFRWSYCLDVNKSFDDILLDMNQRCRRCIKKSTKYPLKFVEVNQDNINDFKLIMEHTAKRQNHFDRTLDYYKSIDREFGDDSKLLIVYLDKEKFTNEFKQDKLFDIVSKDKRKMIPVSAGLFIFDSKRCNYVYGGTYKQYMSLMAQYKLQIEMINLAKKRGVTLYDFGGISGDFRPGSKNFGVYDFKRGFGGYVVEYIGEFDLVLSKFGYNIYDISYEFYRGMKHFVAKIIKN